MAPNPNLKVKENIENTEFPPLKNDLLLRAAKHEFTERVPIWIMRQAGRYLPEFQEVRKDHDFFTICRTPKLACEVTLQPLRRFDFDAAIIFSDILVIPQAMGMEVEMIKGVGPNFPSPLESPSDMEKLKLSVEEVDVRNSLGYVMEALNLTRHSIGGHVPLLGFGGAPWTLMAYMIEGRGSKTFSKAKRWLYRYPKQVHHLLKCMSDIIIEYLVQQIQSGAQGIQVFESWGAELTIAQFREFSLPYLQRISRGIREHPALAEKEHQPPLILFAKGTYNHSMEHIVAESGYDIIAIDYTVDMKHARTVAAQHGKVIQGNLDPCALYASPEDIQRMTREMVHAAGTQSYIANLGHGVLPDIPVEGVRAFVDAVHETSEEINNN
eukprot:gb/GECH01004347.1/.p1 GENE.gb/GECH01004347.1/~~gb/GECH01004347.1/.p1  ORF type:complete len:382 (+),score=93.63 gb/GECH01004347.1/:1-1146(+)